MTNEYARSVASGLLKKALGYLRFFRQMREVNGHKGAFVGYYLEKYENHRDRAMRVRCIIVAPVKPLPLP